MGEGEGVVRPVEDADELDPLVRALDELVRLTAPSGEKGRVEDRDVPSPPGELVRDVARDDRAAARLVPAEGGHDDAAGGGHSDNDRRTPRPRAARWRWIRCADRGRAGPPHPRPVLRAAEHDRRGGRAPRPPPPPARAAAPPPPGGARH